MTALISGGDPSGIPHDIKSRSLFAFYSAGALREIIPIYPLYSVMFLANGISPLELSLLFIIWASVGVLFEVPSGALADRFSRKWLIVAAGFFKSAAFICWFCWQDFSGYALGFILWGVGSSLRSGAFEALLYETLQKWQESSRFTYHFGRIRALSTLSIMIGEASGGLLITFGFDFVLLISAAIPVLVSIPFIFYVKDITAQIDDQKANLLHAGFREARDNSSIRMILIITTFLLTVHGVFDEYIPPLFQEHGFSLAMIAFLAIPVFAAQALGEYLADRFEHWDFNTQLALVVAAGCCLIPAAMYSNWVTVLATTLFFFAFGLASTLIETKLQRVIKTSARATVTSIVGLGESLGAILWFLLFGTAAQWLTFAHATLLLGFATVLLGLGIHQYRSNINEK